jgi:uncharacterized protein (DUF697 family)
MAGIKDLSSVWNNVKEIDLRPLAEDATRGLRIAVIGDPTLGGEALAEAMRHDPSHPEAVVPSPVLVAGVEAAGRAAQADLVILLLDEATQDDTAERSLAQSLTEAGIPVLVLICRPAPWRKGDVPPLGLGHWTNWSKRRVIVGPPDDASFLIKVFAPAVLHLVPERMLPLGRHFPLFRVPIVHQLIIDTCFANATYALSTGIAEIVPVFDIPLNITDMIVLGKAQAFLVYKLGLVLGMSTRWQDYVAEFGSVLGSGFLWRQVARQLIGLIPAWGIIPKVAISYAGTYVVGNVVLQWYLTGRHVTSQQMRQLYSEAFARGKNLAGDLLKKLPRPKGRKGRQQKILPAPPEMRVCLNCSRASAMDATFCQYCGHAFE